MLTDCSPGKDRNPSEEISFFSLRICTLADFAIVLVDLTVWRPSLRGISFMLLLFRRTLLLHVLPVTGRICYDMKQLLQT